MPRRLLLFLRPTFYAVVAVAVSLGAMNFAEQRNDGSIDRIGPSGLSPEELGTLDLERVVLPKPALLPADVVQLQLAGLGDANADGVGILQCFCFASPANRAVTGPLDRFGRMVRLGPYGCMARPQAVLVGRPQVKGRVASVLVTVVDEHSQVRAFTFVLARQQDAPFEDCWMTESVFSALPTAPPGEVAPIDNLDKAA